MKQLTEDFLTHKIAGKAKIPIETARAYAAHLYETAVFYRNKYGEEYFIMSITITCRLCGSNIAELNEYIKNHTGIDNYYEKP